MRNNSFSISTVVCIAGVCISTLASINGCGQSKASDVPQLVDVSGRVTRNGKPLVGATVTFFPQEVGKNASVGVTDEDGHYELRYSNLKGAVPGTHKVTISLMTLADGSRFIPEEEGMDLEQLRIQGKLRESIPAKFGSQLKTKLTCRVQADQPNEKDFELRDP